jgi:hypothetical protein
MDKSTEGKKLAKVLRQYGQMLNASAAPMEGFGQKLPLNGIYQAKGD